MSTHHQPRMDAPIETTPMMRANVVRLSITQLDTLGSAMRDAVMSRIEPEVLAAIRDAGALSWIDAGLQEHINQVLFHTLSRPAYDEFWLEMSSSATEKGIFGDIARGAMRMFGVTPRALYRVIARAHRYATRGLGLYEVTMPPDEDKAILRYYKVPQLVRESEAWRASTLSTFSGPMRTLDVEGDIQVDESRMHSDHEMIYTMTWKARG